MNIIIAGDGKVGATLTRQLSTEGCDITLIDLDPRVLENSMERYDVMAVNGNCASMPVLLQAGISDADLLIAALRTGQKSVNLKTRCLGNELSRCSGCKQIMVGKNTAVCNAYLYHKFLLCVMRD